jgi:class 3 adenylate cyclase
MGRLDAAERTGLRDTAFAYVDSRGRRRLPIHDESHVRNALSRFNQVVFEDEASRDRARTRLLKAAKKYGIVPIGFMAGQLRAQGVRSLPSGVVTFLLTDIEASTALLQQLGDRYASLLADSRRLIRAAVRRSGGHEVDARADEFFAVFHRAPMAVDAALAIQRRFRDHAWTGGAGVKVRIGLHSGRPTLSDNGYVGLSVHTVARISDAAHGGQILLSRAVMTAVGSEPVAGIQFLDLGRHRLRGLPDAESLYQVSVADLPVTFPPPRLGER